MSALSFVVFLLSSSWGIPGNGLSLRTEVITTHCIGKSNDGIK